MKENKKRIIFVSLSLHGGGAERVVSILSSNLAEKGIDVHLIIYDRKDNEYGLNDKVKLYVLSDELKNNKSKGFMQRILVLKRLIRKIDGEIVIPFLAMPTRDTWLATRGIKIEFYATVRNNPSIYPTDKRLRNFINLITRKADKIILQTESQKHFFQNVDSKKLYIIPNPVKQSMVDQPYRQKQIITNLITCGRLNRQKNHTLMIESFYISHKKHPELKLFIYGDGEEAKHICDLIDQFNLNDSVFVMGRTDNVEKCLQECDLFILSSDYEGMPNALMEAMAIGLPCISTDCPTGPSDLIEENITGVLVPVGKADMMAMAINSIVENPKFANRLGINAKMAIADKYSIDRVIATFMELIECN